MASRRLLEYSILHEGVTRTALLYVPQHMSPRGRLPLVLVFHGGMSNPQAISKISAMHRLAEREGFIVAYPAGLPGRSGLTWSPAGKKDARKIGDTRFVRELIIDLQRRYQIDPTRIFAAGFSIGGSLVYELACVLADRIAAAAVVCGAMTTTYCDPARAVSLIHIHGTKDQRVPLKGGKASKTSAANQWLPVQDGIDRWCEINKCSREPQVVRLGIEGAIGYQHRGGADVELWLVEGSGHKWPGGRRIGKDAVETSVATTGFSATEKIWSFFAEHSRSAGNPLPVTNAADRSR